MAQNGYTMVVKRLRFSKKTSALQAATVEGLDFLLTRWIQPWTESVALYWAPSLRDDLAVAKEALVSPRFFVGGGG